MKLHDLLSQYIAFRQSLGENFTSQARVLRHFGHFIGTDLEVAGVRIEQIKAFLNGELPLTSYWHRKFSILRGFYNYAIGRGLVTSSPLPQIIPKRPSSHKPYIFSKDELRRLLDGTVSFRKHTRQIEPQTLRTLLLLLYGAGLRLSEALALNQVDVDLSAALLTIRETKFYKTRLVPLSADLSQALMNHHSRCKPAADGNQPFFTGKNGARLTDHAVRKAFRQLRNSVGICRDDQASYPPRLHDLRHSFAVHRLVSWYQSDADVQKLLPHLATYLGHVNLAATQIYLTMTPDLLEAASARFAEYVFTEVKND